MMTYWRHAVVTSVGALLALGCGGDSGPEKLTAADINGAWDFDITRKPNTPGSFCTSGGRIVATFDFHEGEEVGNTVSDWSNDPDEPGRWTLIGNINYITGETELRFWTRVLDTGWMLLGQIRSDLTFEGVLADPIPGFKAYFFAGCQYDVTGRKRG
jgi:hypothetical protein